MVSSRAVVFAYVFFASILFTATGENRAPSVSLSTEGTGLNQTIGWDRVEFAGGYRLEVIDASGTNVFDATGSENSRELALAAGSYRYRITVFNLLGNPDAIGPWIPFTVRKALAPSIDSVYPSVLVSDDKPSPLYVRGENLSSETKFSLIDPESGFEVFALDNRGPDAEGAFVLSLPAASIDPRYLTLRAKNPGGLFFDAPNAVRIVLRRPVSVAISAGWSPYIPAYDGWYTGIWNGGIYPPGASIRCSVSKSGLKKAAFGIRGSASFNRADTSSEGMTIRTDIRRLDAVIFYGTKIGSRFFASAGAGGGAAWTFISMSRDESAPDGGTAVTASSTGIYALSPSINAFAELRCDFFRRATLSLGLDVVDTVSSGNHLVSLVPSIAAGWLF